MPVSPGLRIALADPAGNINPNLDSLSVAELADALGISSTVTTLQRRVDIEAFVTVGQNDGDSVAVNNINWIGRWGLIDQGAKQAYVLQSAIVVQPITYRAIDGRSAYQLNSAAGGGRGVLIVRPFNQTFFKLDFRDTFRAVTATPGVGTQPPEATVYMSWIRKSSAGAGTSCLQCFGFQDAKIISPSGPISRAGLLGDGAGGFRYGSVNCPDGLAAGENNATDIDAGAVQPADLVAPGVGWWHSAIKIVPPLSPTQNGRWGAYHNGGLVKIFDTLANFPRGAQAASDDFTMNEVETYIGNATLSLAFYKTRYVITEDTTLGDTLSY